MSEQVITPTVSTRTMLLRAIDIKKYRYKTATASIPNNSAIAECYIHTANSEFWITDIFVYAKDAQGKNIIAAMNSADTTFDADLRIFMNIDGQDYTDKSMPIAALATNQDGSELFSGFKMPANAKMVIRVDARPTTGTPMQYPVKVDVVAKGYEM